MCRGTPISTRTYTLVPYTTLFLSGVQFITLAVQLLELVAEPAVGVTRAADRRPCHVVDGRNGLRVVGGEHRVDRVGGVEQAPRAGLAGHIGIGLAGEPRVPLAAVDLGPLDPGLPFRPLATAPPAPPPRPPAAPRP